MANYCKKCGKKLPIFSGKYEYCVDCESAQKEIKKQEKSQTQSLSQNNERKDQMEPSSLDSIAVSKNNEINETLIGGIASSRIAFIAKGRRDSGAGIYFTNKNMIIVKSDKTGRAASDVFNRKIILGVIGFILVIIIGLSLPIFLDPIYRVSLIFLCIGGALWLSNKFSNVIVDNEKYPLSFILKNQIDIKSIEKIKSIDIFRGYGLFMSSTGGVIKITDNDNNKITIAINPFPDDGEFQYLTELIQKTVPANLIHSKI